MDGNLERVGRQLSAYLIAEDWAKADELVEQHRAVLGDDLTDFWRALNLAKRQESSQQFDEALASYRQIALSLDQYRDRSTDSRSLPLEAISFLTNIAEAQALKLELCTREHSTEQRDAQLQRLQEISNRVWTTRTEFLLDGLTDDEIQRLDVPEVEMIANTGLLGPTLDIARLLGEHPEILSRPRTVYANMEGMIASVMIGGPSPSQVVQDWLRIPKNGTAYVLRQHAHASMLLRESVNARRTFRFFCDSWRRGVRTSFHNEVVRHCFEGESTAESTFRVIGACYQIEQSTQFEDLVGAYSRGVHTLVELLYKPALQALYALEFQQREFGKIPTYSRQLGTQLHDRWNSRNVTDFLPLVDMDALIVRNAVAHEHIEFLGDRVRFDCRAQRQTFSAGPYSELELRNHWQRLYTQVTAMVGTFHLVYPILYPQDHSRLRYRHVARRPACD